MNTLEKISEELKRMTDGLESDLAAYRRHCEKPPTEVGSCLPRKGGGVEPGGNRKRLRLPHLGVAAGESLVLWHRPHVVMPDTDHTVLLFAADADEPVWLGYHDGEHWRVVDGTPLERVELWGEIPHPDGPRETADHRPRTIDQRLRKEAVYHDGGRTPRSIP